MTYTSTIVISFCAVFVAAFAAAQTETGRTILTLLVTGGGNG
jgi:hypothetical protein